MEIVERQSETQQTPDPDSVAQFTSAEHGTRDVMRADGQPLLVRDIPQGRQVNITFDADSGKFLSDVGLSRKHRRAIKALNRKGDR